MFDFLQQIIDLLFNQKEFELLSNNYKIENKKIQFLISQINNINVLE